MPSTLETVPSTASRRRRRGSHSSALASASIIIIGSRRSTSCRMRWRKSHPHRAKDRSRDRAMGHNLTGLLILNLLGTFIFGLSGGFLAVRKHLDLFGVLVLAAAAALGGGITRDVLL